MLKTIIPTTAVLVILACATNDAGTSEYAALSVDMLNSYYQVPELGRRIREVTTNRGHELEICADHCDLFILERTSPKPAVWDAAAIYKGLLSENTIDEPFAKQNKDDIDRLLHRYAHGQCSEFDDSERIAICVLKRLEANHGLRYAHVRYDEKMRCESFWTLEIPSRLLEHRCDPVKE